VLFYFIFSPSNKKLYIVSFNNYTILIFTITDQPFVSDTFAINLVYLKLVGSFNGNNLKLYYNDKTLLNKHVKLLTYLKYSLHDETLDENC
jgi:hypothetical protein